MASSAPGPQHPLSPGSVEGGQPPSVMGPSGGVPALGIPDVSPLSVACARALNDKMYDKRKAAATEIEKYI